MNRLQKSRIRAMLLTSAAFVSASLIVAQSNQTTGYADEIVLAKADINPRPRAVRKHYVQPLLDLEKLKRASDPDAVADLFAAKSLALPPPVIAAPPAPVAPPPPPVPTAPALPFSYVGKLVIEDEVTLFLVQQNQNVSAKLHDVIDNTYRIEQISENDVVFTYLPLNTQQSLNIRRN